MFWVVACVAWSAAIFANWNGWIEYAEQRRIQREDEKQERKYWDYDKVADHSIPFLNIAGTALVVFATWINW